MGGAIFALEGNKCLPLSMSSSINYRTELEEGKEKKLVLDPVLVTSQGYMSCHVAPCG